MDSKYNKTALMIVLCVIILLASVSTGFSKYSKKHHSHPHQKYSSAKTEQISGNLVLGSAAAPDSETGYGDIAHRFHNKTNDRHGGA